MEHLPNLRGRAYHRHQQERAKNRAKRFMRMVRWEISPRFVGLRANTRQPCSCIGCGHRAFWDGPPVRDLRKLA